MLSFFLAAPAAAQDRHVVASSDLAKAVATHSAARDADRAVVQEALRHPEVRMVAAKTGLDLTRLSDSVDSLSPETLARAASAARDVNSSLVGGANTITISTTTIIIILLLIILIIVA